jgi:phage I-like protein
MLQIAVCIFELSDADQPLRLLPLGQFRSMDGRPEDAPAWSLSPTDAQAIAAHVAADPRRRPIDYEHQTLLSRSNGQPAPAAGWFHQLAVDNGLVATDVDWTERAHAMLAAREYRYLSPVFSYEPGTGRVVDLLHAALTNTPALAQLGEIQLAAASAFSHPEVRRSMNPETLTLLSLPAQASEADIHIAVAQLQARITEDERQLAALKTPDPAQYVPIVVANDLRQQLGAERQALAELRQAQAEAEREQLITVAAADGRLPGEAMITWAKTLPIEALRSYLAVAQPITALTQSQTAGKTPSSLTTVDPDKADPSDVENFKAVCRAAWDRGDAALRTEFGGSFSTYLAYQRANAQGHVRILGVKTQ